MTELKIACWSNQWLWSNQHVFNSSLKKNNALFLCFQRKALLCCLNIEFSFRQGNIKQILLFFSGGGFQSSDRQLFDSTSFTNRWTMITIKLTAWKNNSYNFEGGIGIRPWVPALPSTARDGCPQQAASKVLQPRYKTNYNQDTHMLRYILFRSISRKLFNHKGCRAACSVGVLIIREEESKEKKPQQRSRKDEATPSLPHFCKPKSRPLFKYLWHPQESVTTRTRKEIWIPCTKWWNKAIRIM
jgi:hypothetical protein